jgi:tetratricopeptide (TPR) repeat protein
MRRTAPVTAAASTTAAEKRRSPTRLFGLIPPADLLSRVEGVEPALRRGHALQRVGWGAFGLSALSALGSVFTSNWWKEIHPGASFGGGLHQWLLVAGVAGVVVAFVLVGWLRLWVRASRTPFRYTYSIEPFEPVEGTAEEPQMAWLRHDLSTRLSRRIRRLSLLDERYSGTTDAPEAHIHIGGVYGVRKRSSGESVIEVMPWVRLGPTGSAATLAHQVRFALRSGPDELKSENGAASYEKLVERVYFSVATRIYRQIRVDVKRKIDLLPRRYFRAAAYFYEAEDYIRSNTLDAYKQAQKLYAEVIDLYSPDWGRPRHASSAGRMFRIADHLLAAWSLGWRRWLAWLWPGLGKVEVMVARAELGYARTLVYRRAVAGFSGQRLNPIFEARPVAARAVRRLKRLRKDVPGRRKRLFDALVTDAAVLGAVGAFDDADNRLQEARSLDPARAEQNGAYMHVQGKVETRQRAYYFQRAGELFPSFEVSQFERAVETELLWRRRPMKERNVADMVAAEYERVLELNPGNVSAWANLGYMYWLLKEPEKARRALERGREYKQMREATFVAELDYCLARIAAEAGEWERAYSHYVDAVAGHIAQGVWQAPDGYTAFQFVAISDWMLERFTEYRRTVKRHWRKAHLESDATPDATTPRVRDAVYAFVLNDFGEASLNYWLRSGEDRYLRIAGSAFETALQGPSTLRHEPAGSLGSMRSETRNPMVSFNLSRLRRWEIDWIDTSQLDVARPDHAERALLEARKLLDVHPRDTHIDRALTYEPSWSDGLVEKAWSDMVLARKSRDVADTLARFAAARRKDARELEADAFSRGGVGTLLSEPHDPHEKEFRRTLAGSPNSTATTGASLAEQKREESRTLEHRAAELDEKASLLRAAAGDFDVEARAAPEKLLPHDWLRSGGSFDWRAPGRRRLAHLWERELDVPHVWAIFAVCRAELSRLEGVEGWRARREARKTRHRIWRMLKLIRERFWPEDIDILLTCQEFPGRKAEEQDEFLMRIRSLVRRWCELDPSYWSFQYLMWADVKLRGERLARSLEDVQQVLLAELDRIIRRALRRRPWKAVLSSDGVKRLLPTLRRNRFVARIAGDQIDDELERLATIRENSELATALESLNDRLTDMRERGAVQSSLYVEFADFFDRHAVNDGEKVARSLATITQLVERLQQSHGDRGAVYQRIARVLGNVGDARGAAIADALSSSLELLQTMRGDRGVPPTLYAQIGDALRTRGHAEGALAAYTRGADMLHGKRSDAATSVGIGRLEWQRGRYDEAVNQFALLNGRSEAFVTGWRCDLVSELLANPAPDGRDADRGYRLLKNWLGRELTTAHDRALRLRDNRSASAAEDAAAAVLQVTRDRYVELVHRRGSSSLEEAPRPVASAILEVDRRFLLTEENEQLPVVAELLDKDIPALRKRTPVEVGLMLPPVVLHASAVLEPNAYRVHVDGAPVARCTFAAATAGGEEGKSPREQMMEHLRSALLRHPDGLPLSPRAIELYRECAGRSPAQAARVRLAVVLRALVREGVPIRDLRAVVQSFVAAEHRIDTNEVVEQVRFSLRRTLPGADCSCRLFALPPELEAQISELVRSRHTARFLATSNGDVHSMDGALDDVLAEVDDGAALVVLAPGLRRFVHVLVARRRPEIPVLAYNELPDGSMPLIASLRPRPEGP